MFDSGVLVREVTPTRKRGPVLVNDVSNIRPERDACEIDAVLDAICLFRCKGKLEQYVGGHQHRGRCDALLAASAIVAAAQLQLGARLLTLIKKADLWQGFDLTWRSACLLQLWQSQVQGRDWLLQDAAFSSDIFRVKLLHGPVRQLFDFPVGQGKRARVHFFNLVGKKLADLGGCSPGVGLGYTAQDVTTALQCCSAYYQADQSVRPEALLQILQQAGLQLLGTTGHPDHFPTPGIPANISEKLVALESLASITPSTMQFVDDVFSLQSTAFGINEGCYVTILVNSGGTILPREARARASSALGRG